MNQTIPLNEHHLTLCKTENISVEQLLRLIGVYKNIPWAAKLNVEAPDLLTKSGTTVKGLAILNEIFKQELSDFNRWWNAYPATDGHAHFPSLRSLRLDWAKCKRLFDDILAQGYDADTLIDALKEDVKARKINSIQRNELAYFPIAPNYLEKGYWQIALNNETSDEPAHSNRSRIL